MGVLGGLMVLTTLVHAMLEDEDSEDDGDDGDDDEEDVRCCF